jgi:hypothetical protein
MKPGQTSIGFVYFQVGTTTIPANVTFDFTVTTSPVGPPASFGHTDFRVTEANLIGSSVVGTAINGTGQTLTGPYPVNVFCFNTAGGLVGATGDFANPDADAAPGATVSFQVALYNPCSTFLVGVSAFFK